MKIAVIYNRDSQNVINLFGVPNREKYGLEAIRRITDALRKGRHRVISFEGDKDLIRRLEEFMPRVLKGERPGMVFNLSYGIQGRARYTHVPGLLEMLGMPYVGSGPLAHSLSLDKVVAKMLFCQHGLPTPDFFVLQDPDFSLPDIEFPMIVKPKNESTSFGLRIAESEEELREAAQAIFEQFHQPVLVEEYIAGREINVGLLGNSPPTAFPPAVLLFPSAPSIFTMEDKKGESGRTIGFSCPANLDPAVARRAQDIALRAFQVLGCSDCARVDMRLTPADELYVLEVNSLPSLSERGSYTLAAEAIGLDFVGLVNRLVEVASARYFGTPHPPKLSRRGGQPGELVFSFVTQRRDRMERRLKQWTSISSRTSDPIGIRNAFKELNDRFLEIGMQPRGMPGENQAVGVWETEAGLDGGTLLICHLDVPVPLDVLGHGFRREPEWLYGEGIGTSRGPFVMLEFALRALKAQGFLRRLHLGVLCCGDEGFACEHSAETIRTAAHRARRVLVLSPGTPKGRLVIARRGLRKYRLVAETEPRRLGQSGKKPDALSWLCERLTELSALTNSKNRIGVAAEGITSRAFPSLLPHQASAVLVVSYPSTETAETTEEQIRCLLDKRGCRWTLDKSSDRPPMREQAGNAELARQMAEIAAHREIPLEYESSVMPSAAGLVPIGIPVLCGCGPVAADLFTPQERIQRISLVQRTLVLGEFLTHLAGEGIA